MPTLPRILASIGAAIIVALVFGFWLSWPGFLAVGAGAIFGVGLLVAATAIGVDPREEDAAWQAEAGDLSLVGSGTGADVTTLPSVGSYVVDELAAARFDEEAEGASRAVDQAFDEGQAQLGQEREWTEGDLGQRLTTEGLIVDRWANGPSDRYPAHAHAYDKVIVVASGSIVFGLPATTQRIHLGVGDRLELPAGTEHDAIVGAHGVSCLEAHLPARSLTAGARRIPARDWLTLPATSETARSAPA